MKKLVLLPLLCFVAFLLFAKTPVVNRARHDYSDTPHMKQYWLVMLLKGANRTQDSATAEKIQEGHMANIRRLAQEGKLIMAGPMGHDKDLRGIFILDAKDSATAASYVASDPAINIGRLRAEIHPWWTQTGTYIFK